MHFVKFYGQRTLLLALTLVLALVLSACDDEPEAAVVEEPVVAEEVVEAEADVEVVEEAEAEAEADVDAVTTAVETEVIEDTDVITQTEVLTETEQVEIVTETTVMTDTDVTVDTETDVKTEVSTETADVDDTAFALIIIEDEAGNAILGDAAEQRPIYVYTGNDEGLILDPDFEAIEFNDEIIVGEGLDQELLGEIDNDGFLQLTYNERPLYRFVGEEGMDAELAIERGFSPLSEAGELFE